jgi:hypothetical protein
VELNDAALADLPLADTFLDLRVHAPEALSRRGLNLIALTSDARAEVDLLRLERRPSAPVAE